VCLLASQCVDSGLQPGHSKDDLFASETHNHEFETIGFLKWEYRYLCFPKDGSFSIGGTIYIVRLNGFGKSS
jgi:hypothetical protein